MKIGNPYRPVMSTWLMKEGHRLDAPPFLSGAVEARVLLDKLTVPKLHLNEVTQDIYHAGRESRKWVQDPDHGVPFMSSSDILTADLSTLPLISKKQIQRNPRFIIREGWTLITRSGTVGRMAFARPEMDGLACSEHVLRVVPNPEVILPGYLYGYLSSYFGKTLIASGTYGAIIQHIEPEHIADLQVPRFGKKLENEVHNLIKSAGDDRSKANNLIKEATERFSQVINLTSLNKKNDMIAIVPSSLLVSRLDGYYYQNCNSRVREAFDDFQGNTVEIDEVADVFIPGIFKRLYATDPEFGVPYVTGNNVFQASPTADTYLMKKVVEENNLILKKGMIVIQEAGQLGGLIGRSAFIGDRLNGFACSNNMARIIAKDDSDVGYLFACIYSEYGYRLISRESAGSSIPHLDSGRLKRISIPWPESETRNFIGEPIIEAMKLSDNAWQAENQACQLVERAIEQNYVPSEV